MKQQRKRKPRTTGADLGFDGSHMFGQAYNADTPAAKKLWKRFKAGLCLGCGEKSCRCKSKSRMAEWSIASSWKGDEPAMAP